jgi:hypothetical protein
MTNILVRFTLETIFDSSSHVIPSQPQGLLFSRLDFHCHYKQIKEHKKTQLQSLKVVASERVPVILRYQLLLQVFILRCASFIYALVQQTVL